MSRARVILDLCFLFRLIARKRERETDTNLQQIVKPYCNVHIRVTTKSTMDCSHHPFYFITHKVYWSTLLHGLLTKKEHLKHICETNVHL